LFPITFGSRGKEEMPGIFERIDDKKGKGIRVERGFGRL